MFYVFTNIQFLCTYSDRIPYYFPNNVHQLAYNKLMELAQLTSFMQNTTSSKQTHRFTRQLNLSSSRL